MISITLVSFFAAAVALVIGTYYVLLHILFEQKEKTLGKAMAQRVSLKRKKNVAVWGTNGTKHVWQIVHIVKDWRCGWYEYTVNGKKYTLRVTSYDAPEETAQMLCVRYCKAFPRIAKAKSAIGYEPFGIYAFAAFGAAVILVLMGIGGIAL
ncbi:MAG: hypothetical protein IJV96_02535 [Clostridia bacterium]|nr:hypothetical protein [Clostridia bacterium]